MSLFFSGHPDLKLADDLRFLDRYATSSKLRVNVLANCAGGIPSELGELSALTELILSRNNLTGGLYFLNRVCLNVYLRQK